MYLMHNYSKKRRIKAISRFENHFYYECYGDFEKIWYLFVSNFFECKEYQENLFKKGSLLQ